VGYVSIIGESWGGIVALKMAQILENQGTLVTVSLLEGDPEILTIWSKSFLSNHNLTNKLKTMYCSCSNKVNIYKFNITIYHLSSFSKGLALS